MKQEGNGESYGRRLQPCYTLRQNGRQFVNALVGIGIYDIRDAQRLTQGAAQTRNLCLA